MCVVCCACEKEEKYIASKFCERSRRGTYSQVQQRCNYGVPCPYILCAQRGNQA
jgi:hypothetical protein